MDRTVDTRNSSGAAASRGDNYTYWYILVLPWVFDYRADQPTEGDVAIQATVLVVSMFGLVSFLYRARAVPLSSRFKAYLGLFATWLGGAALVSLLRDGDPVNLFKAMAPVLVALSGAIFMYKTLFVLNDKPRFINNVLYVMLLFAVYKLIHEISVYGENFLSVRYHIFSAPSNLLSGYIVSRYFIGFSARQLFPMFVQFSIVLMSLTRSVMLMLAFLFFTPYLLSLSMLFRGVALKRILILSCAVLTLISIGVSSGNPIFLGWVDRFAPDVAEDVGLDPTTATRLAEIDFQVATLMESTTNLLVGMGLTAETSLTGDWAILLVAAGVQDPLYLHDRGIGHCLYTSYFFNGGIIFGTFGMLASLYLLWVAIRLVAHVMRSARRDEVAFIGLWGALTCIGLSIIGLASGIFGDRGDSLFFGFAVGLMYWGYDILMPGARSAGVRRGRPTRAAVED